MIGSTVICVLLHDMQGGGQKLIKHPQVGRRSVSGHLYRPLILLACLSEKLTGGGQIPLSPRRKTSMTWPNWSIARYR
jgi:hypothetical protein